MFRSLRKRLLVSYLTIVAIFVGGVVATLLLISGVDERTQLLVDRYWQDNNLIAQIHNLLGDVTRFLTLSPGTTETTVVQRELQVKIDHLVAQLASSTFQEEFRSQQISQLSQLKSSLAAPLEALARLDRQTRTADTLLEQLIEAAKRLERPDLARDLAIAGLAYRDYYITTNPSDLEIFRQQMDRVSRLSFRGWRNPLVKEFRAEGEAVFERRQELRDSREQITAQVRRLSDSLRTRSELYAERVIYPAREEIQARLSFIPNVLLAAVIVSALAALAISLLMTNRISAPMERTAEALKRIEKGDLAVSIGVSGNDEIDLLGRAVNSLAVSLRQTLEDLHHSVAQLSESEERYRQIAEQRLELERIINSSPTLAFLCRITDGYPVEFVSASLNQFGYQPAEFLEREMSILTIVHPEDRVRLDSQIAGQVAGQEGREFFQEFRIQTRQGEIRWVDGRMLVQRDEQGGAIRLQGVLLDITEKLHMREQAARSSRLASLGELAAGVGHEINNPNATILLNATVLSDITEGMLRFLDQLALERGELALGRMPYSRLRVEIPRLQTEVLESAGRIRRIVEDLKEFVCAESPENYREVDVNDVVQAAVRLTGNVIKKATDQFTSTYAPELPKLQGSPQRLEQVAVNLLMNACQALPDRQRGISVRTGCTADGVALYLEVEDQGVGISAEDLPHVTDPFFTTRREKGGTGLGLSISTRIVKEHNGQIEVNSVAGSGTIVRVVLPLSKEQVS